MSLLPFVRDYSPPALLSPVFAASCGNAAAAVTDCAAAVSSGALLRFRFVFFFDLNTTTEHGPLGARNGH